MCITGHVNRELILLPSNGLHDIILPTHITNVFVDLPVAVQSYNTYVNESEWSSMVKNLNKSRVLHLPRFNRDENRKFRRRGRGYNSDSKSNNYTHRNKSYVLEKQEQNIFFWMKTQQILFRCLVISIYLYA